MFRLTKAVDITLMDTYSLMNRKTVMIAENTLRFQFSSRHSENATVISDIHSVFNKKGVHIQEEFHSKLSFAVMHTPCS